MLVHLLSVLGVSLTVVVFGLVMRGAHEHQRAEKRRLGISCAHCSDKGSCASRHD